MRNREQPARAIHLAAKEVDLKASSIQQVTDSKFQTIKTSAQGIVSTFSARDEQTQHELNSFKLAVLLVINHSQVKYGITLLQFQ